MSRSIMDEPAEKKPEPTSTQLMEMIWAVAIYMEDIEKKIDAIMQHLNIDYEEPPKTV